MNTDEILALILGGGKGTRLYPLTRYRAKPAVPIAGKFRLIDLPLSNCLNSEIWKMYVLTQFNTHSLHRHIYDTYRFGRFTRGFVHILAAQQTAENMDWYQGTADAVRQNLHYIANTNTKYTLILSGDHLYRMDYRYFVQQHLDNKAAVSVSVKPVNAQEATQFGILQTNQEGRIIRFVEKPDKSQLAKVKSPGLPAETPYLASMGIYLFNTDILIKSLEEIEEDDFGGDIIPRIIESQQVYAYPFQGYWKDIGTIEAFFKANLELASINPPFTLYDEQAPFYTRPRFLPSSRIESCHVKQALVADGCYIMGSEINKAIIGLRARIHKDTSIEDTVIMGADYYENEPPQDKPPIGVGTNCRIKNAIIDKNVRIGNNVEIRNIDDVPYKDSKTYSIRDGIVVIPKNAIIPENTKI